MSRYDNTRRGRSRPETYIRTVSATIVAFAKVIEGLISAYAVFVGLQFLLPLLGQMTGGAFKLDQLTDQLLDPLYAQIPGLEQSIGSMLSAAAAPVALLIGISVLGAVLLIMRVIEMIALLMVRFAGKGASAVRVVHWVEFARFILYLLLLGYGVFRFIQAYPSIQKMPSVTSDSMTAITIIGVAVAVILLIVLILNLCYHKDVALAMGTVSYELQTGLRGDRRRTHLSGISILFGVFYALVIIILLLSWLALLDETGGALRESTGSFVMSLAMVFISMLKYFAVAKCNRNLKRS